MKLLLFLSIIALFAIPQAYANMLENSDLHAESHRLSLDVSFGEDTIVPLKTRILVESEIDSINLALYDEKIPLINPQVKTYNNGEMFRISSVESGVIMYGYYNSDFENYTINIYFNTHQGMEKFMLRSDLPQVEEIIIQEEEEEIWSPDLAIAVNHDPRTYWRDTFNIDVQVFNAAITPDPKPSNFDGRISEAQVDVLITLEDKEIVHLSGLSSKNGHWEGEYFFEENLSMPGEYIVDVLVTHLEKSASKTSSMFVIAKTLHSDSSNNPPIADAGPDQTVVTNEFVTLDASGSSDTDDVNLTYLWNQIGGIDVDLSDETVEMPTFTPTIPDILEFQLVVTDPGGKASTDTVIVTVEIP